MINHLYQNTILKNPRSILIILLIALISFGYYSKDFRLDASSETLLIEGDPDLEYLKEVKNRYGSKEFLVLTYTPIDSMISDSAINNLLSLKYKLQSLDWVHSVVTLLDIPLLDNSDEPLQEKLFGCMSKRAAANIMDEMEALGPVRLTEVQGAQKEIINVARRLSDEGTIVLAGRGGDDFV